MTKYYIDTEFAENGTTIDLISIGVVCEDGRKYYAQHSDLYLKNVNSWVRDNVISQLKRCYHLEKMRCQRIMNSDDFEYHHNQGQCMSRRRWVQSCPWRTREQMEHDLLDFIDNDKPEFYGWITSYDFIMLCQIFCGFENLPSIWPHYIKDLQCVLDERGISDSELPQQDGIAHNALADVLYVKSLWEIYGGENAKY
jgi:3' exoribonuclease, RNase T-like